MPPANSNNKVYSPQTTEVKKCSKSEMLTNKQREVLPFMMPQHPTVGKKSYTFCLELSCHIYFMRSKSIKVFVPTKLLVTE